MFAIRGGDLGQGNRKKRFEGEVPGAVLARAYGINSQVVRKPMRHRPS
jgi:hypothetical protein